MKVLSPEISGRDIKLIILILIIPRLIIRGVTTLLLNTSSRLYFLHSVWGTFYLTYLFNNLVVVPVRIFRT